MRYRHKVVEARTNAKTQVHAVLAKQGVRVPMSNLFGVRGNKLLNDVALDDAYLIRVESRRDLIALQGREIGMLDRAITTRGRREHGSDAAVVRARAGHGPRWPSVLIAPTTVAPKGFMPPRRGEGMTDTRALLGVPDAARLSP